MLARIPSLTLRIGCPFLQEQRGRDMPKPIIDLRSDTLTRPTQAMRQAMAEAIVGDDMFSEDPTVNALEERFAQLTGHQAALFVPSGTMANQLAIRSHTQPGDELITHPDSHIVHYETGAVAALSGVTARFAHGPNGTFDADQLISLIQPDNVHCGITRLVTLENTHNRSGGCVWPVATLHQVIDAAHQHSLCVHIDGARIWNAAVATNTPVRDLANQADTISACLSKGLGCPVGSLLAGKKPIIDRARHFRKMFGGAMRQAGILAAAGLYALDHHIDRLADDHANAQRLAQALANMPGIHVDPTTVQTNLVYFAIDPGLCSASQLVTRMSQAGVLVFADGPQRIRAVTHLDVSDEDIMLAIDRIHRIVKELTVKSATGTHQSEPG